MSTYFQERLYAARQLKRKGKLFATWSDAGKLKVRVTAESGTVVVKTLDDLRKLVGDDPALELPAAGAESRLGPAARPESTAADATPGPAPATQGTPTTAGEDADGFQAVPTRGRSGLRKK